MLAVRVLRTKRSSTLATLRCSPRTLFATPKQTANVLSIGTSQSFHVTGQRHAAGTRMLHATPARRSQTSTESQHHIQSDPAVDIFCDLVPATGEGKGYIATVTMSNPKRLNSMTDAMVKKLGSTLCELAQRPDLRCLVIQGARTSTKSQSFTSGANIYQMASIKSYDEAREFITGLHKTCQAMREFPVPTIAKIDGLCLGGGLELAAGCDFRYATRTSTFSMPETKFAIPSVIEARLLANVIGWQKAKEMVYFAKFYTAEQVEPWGLVDRSCEDLEELNATVQDAVGIIASFGPKAIREQKALCRFWEENDLVAGIDAGIASYARMFEDGGSEPGHYMKAFTERKR